MHGEGAGGVYSGRYKGIVKTKKGQEVLALEENQRKQQEQKYVRDSGIFFS